MGFLAGLFGSKSEDPTNVRIAILAYCYGNMASMAFANLFRFVETFREDSTRALRARLFSAGMMRGGVSIDQRKIADISATIIALNNLHSLLLFDFSAYGGVFSLKGTSAICPSYVGIVFDTNCVGPPAIFLLEPSFEPGSTMLINLLDDGARANLGAGCVNRKDSFIELIRSML